MSGFRIGWDEAIGSEDWRGRAAVDVFAGLGWRTLWREADGLRATPVTEAVGHGGALLAVTVNPAFAARCGYVLVPVDRLVPDVTRALSIKGDPLEDEAILALGVHGGVTCAKVAPATALELMSTEGTHVAVIGFDCLHGGDGSDAAVARSLGLPGAKQLTLETVAWRNGQEVPNPIGLRGHPWWFAVVRIGYICDGISRFVAGGRLLCVVFVLVVWLIC